MRKDDSYWQGYIQKQNEAMEICKQCKYRKKANKYDSLVKKIKDEIEEQKAILNHYDEYTKLNILEKLIVDSVDTRIETLQKLLKEAEE